MVTAAMKLKDTCSLQEDFCNHKPNKLQAPRTEQLARVGKTRHSQVTYPATWSTGTFQTDD